MKKKVREYLDTRYPALRKLAEEKKAIIYFIDEASIRSDYHSGTTWSKRGYTPTVTKTGALVSIIAAVSGEGQMRYMTIKGRFNADVFIQFLDSHDSPVLIVTDGHSAIRPRNDEVSASRHTLLPP